MARKQNRHRLERPGDNPGFKPVRLAARTPNQKTYIRSIMSNDVTFCTGPAGTGKTHVAIGLAVQMLKEGHLDRIVVTRPLVSVGKDMGFLPGDIGDKVGPYIQPCFDELNYYLSFSMISQWVKEKKIEIVPLSMMRGRTFNSAFVIIDEAQNATRMELKTALTRIGDPCKMVIAGDLRQSDLPTGEQGAFKEAMDRLYDIDGVEVVNLTETDIVRNRLIGDIINRLW